MQLVTVDVEAVALHQPMAQLLLDGFAEIASDAWTTLDEALEEVQSVLNDGFCRVALDDAGTVIGWVGGLHRYAYVWELHPLVVHPSQQGRGVGRALVLDFEEQARQRGAITVILGSDDEGDLTTLSGIDLYNDIPGFLLQARGSRPHPLEFYRALGYTLVGVIPDANGIGKPDILLAKRVTPP